MPCLARSQRTNLGGTRGSTTVSRRASTYTCSPLAISCFSSFSSEYMEESPKLECKWPTVPSPWLPELSPEFGRSCSPPPSGERLDDDDGEFSSSDELDDWEPPAPWRPPPLLLLWRQRLRACSRPPPAPAVLMREFLSRNGSQPHTSMQRGKGSSRRCPVRASSCAATTCRDTGCTHHHTFSAAMGKGGGVSAPGTEGAGWDIGRPLRTTMQRWRGALFMSLKPTGFKILIATCLANPVSGFKLMASWTFPAAPPPR
mmetsp:Transcript_62571/g.125342  ORF Transcript_62571/g.125342 Transcript_62571/m.125342 type:complete len:258 (-) Transcript_62571:307-1080(-)